MARRGPRARRRRGHEDHPEDLKALNIVDRIVGEPEGGAHADPEAAIRAVGDAVEEELKKLSNLTPDELRRQRAERFYAIGRAGLA